MINHITVVFLNNRLYGTTCAITTLKFPRQNTCIVWLHACRCLKSCKRGAVNPRRTAVSDVLLVSCILHVHSIHSRNPVNEIFFARDMHDVWMTSVSWKSLSFMAFNFLTTRVSWKSLSFLVFHFLTYKC